MLAERAALLRDASDRAVAYLDGLPGRPVAAAASAVERLTELDFELPASGVGGQAALHLLDEVGSPATVVSNGPRYFGFVTGGALPAAQAAAWLSAAWDQNAALAVMSPVAARLGVVALRWLTGLLRLPPDTAGAFVTGATMANATCLAAARDAVLRQHGWDATRSGLSGAPPVSVVVGAEVHAAVRKALGLIGLGRDRAVVLPTDGQGRIIPRGLPPLTGPSIVCLQAGNVNTGASDPFGPLIEWAHGCGSWVHVDGAFGLWAAAAPQTSGEVNGAGRADSWATDCHKWLNTTYDCGVALVRDRDALRAAMQSAASYLPGSSSGDAMDVTPESSQRARGIEVWSVLAALGTDGVAELVAKSCDLAQRFAGQMRAAGCAVLNDVVLNQVLVSFGSAEQTDAVIAAVQADGTCWCGPTTWHGTRAMRVSVSGWCTTPGDIDASAAAVAACAARLAGPRR